MEWCYCFLPKAMALIAMTSGNIHVLDHNYRTALAVEQLLDLLKLDKSNQFFPACCLKPPEATEF